MSTFWERDAHSVDCVFSLYFVYLHFLLFPVVVLRAGLVLIAQVPVHCFLVAFTRCRYSKIFRVQLLSRSCSVTLFTRLEKYRYFLHISNGKVVT